MYLVVDDATKEAAVVDPYDAPKISKQVKDDGVNVSVRRRLAPGSRDIEADV